MHLSIIYKLYINFTKQYGHIDKKYLFAYTYLSQVISESISRHQLIFECLM